MRHVPGAPSNHVVNLWLTKTDVLHDAAVRNAAWRLLCVEEGARAGRFIFDRDRDAFVAAHALTRIVLSRYSGYNPQDIVYRLGKYGKPHLAHPITPPLDFSVSHTRDLAVCAVARDREIGIDVEDLRDPPVEIAERFFAPPEVDVVRALAGPARREAFFAYWTLKESFIKALGFGLSMELDSFAFNLTPPSLLAYGVITTPSDWHFVRFAPTPTSTLALCASTRYGVVPSVRTHWMGPADLLHAAASCPE
jgi:4'-phosphopantetheinyl transferase